MKVVILAGGSGTRLWPLSRRSYPKQFLKLTGGKSLLQITADRFMEVVRPEDVIVITSTDHEFNVRRDLGWLSHIILEPVGRNTAPAIALAVRYCVEKLGCGEDEAIFVSPSDHIIEPVDRFAAYVRQSGKIVTAGHIVTFGIKPARPETGYGYIKADTGKRVEGTDDPAYRVEKFVEKPDLETARRYMADGGYYWNSGMFAFTVATMRRELSIHAPEIGASLTLGFDEMLETFETMPSVSIDYAVMEKSANVALIPAELSWNDIGSWDSMFEMTETAGGPKGSKENVIAVDSDNNVVIGNSRLIATVGLEECVIVDTDDALLVMKKGHGQKVKEVMEQLLAQGRKEAFDHVITHRPWGSFTTLLENQGYKVKKITVNPGGKLSLQLHNQRSEHWTVVRGRAKVTVGDEEKDLGENESVYIPVTARHRLENCGSSLVELIEVQCGQYLGEDDIVRIEDIYGRIPQEVSVERRR